MATDAGHQPTTDESEDATLPEFRELSVDEGWELFDELAHRYLSIDGAEFIRRWDAGEYRGNADRSEVLKVASMLSFGRAKTSRGS